MVTGNLPPKAKELFEKIFRQAMKKTDSDEKKAAQLAWGAVKKIYSKQGTKWVKKSEGKMKKSILQSLVSSSPAYYVEYNVDFGSSDLMGHNVSKELLNRLSEPNFIDNYGSIEHSEYDKDLNIPLNTELVKGKEPYLMDSYKVNGSDLKVKFKLNPEYPDFEKLVEYKKQGHLLNLSPEFKGAVTFNNLICDADKIGWSTTDTPKQPNNKLVSHNID